MIDNYPQAADEINAVAYQAIKTGAAAIVGYVPDVRFANIEKPGTPDGSKFWLRVSMQTVDEAQTTLANQVTGPDKKRFTANGLIFVQIFCPKSVSNSDQLGKQLAELVKNAYRGKSTSGCVWFSHTRIQEKPPEAQFWNYNVVSEFEYDTIG